jgi:chemotaxis methyl-accepting protein methylase
MALSPLVRKIGVAGETIWQSFPLESRRRLPLRSVGKVIHTLSARFSSRQQSTSTWFLRNLPLLQTLCQLISSRDSSQPLRLCSIGCSTGAELYSLLWLLRKAEPKLNLLPVGIDQSPSVVERAKLGTYGRQGPELRDLDDEFLSDMFEQAGSEWKIKNWIGQGVQWIVGDATSSELRARIGPQDVVLANNFLVHMQKPDAEACLTDLLDLTKEGALLVCRGVDLDVRRKIVRKFNLTPIATRLEEIHNANPERDAPHGWPWRYWSLEPFDKSRKDWVERYATIFRVPVQSRANHNHPLLQRPA